MTTRPLLKTHPIQLPVTSHKAEIITFERRSKNSSASKTLYNFTCYVRKATIIKCNKVQT